MPDYDYIRSGDAIYERSFAIIRSEADLSRFSPEEADVAGASSSGQGKRKTWMLHATASMSA